MDNDEFLDVSWYMGNALSISFESDLNEIIQTKNSRYTGEYLFDSDDYCFPILRNRFINDHKTI